MSEKQGSMSDELESGIDTGANIAGKAVNQGLKNLPSRRPDGHRSSAGKNQNTGDANNANPVNSPNAAADPSAKTPSGGTPTGGADSSGSENNAGSGSQRHTDNRAGDSPSGKSNGIPSDSSGESLGSSVPPTPDSTNPSNSEHPANLQNQGKQSKNATSGQNNNSHAPENAEISPSTASGISDSGSNPLTSAPADGGSPAAGSPEAVSNRLPEAQGGATGGAKGNRGIGIPGAGSEAPSGIAGGAGAESGAGLSAGAVGTGGSTAAGSAAGGAAGAGAGAGASGGAAAAGGTAAGGAAGTAGGAAGGAATGAAAGSAAGPVGTVAGAIAGALIVPAIKLLIKIIIIVMVFVMMFSMLPSFLFDNPEAVNDRVAIENTYNHFYKGIADEYEKDIISAKDKAKNNSAAYLTSLKYDLHYVIDERVKLTDEDITEIQEGIADAYSSSSRYVHWRANTETLKTIEEYKEAISGNINMVLSMIDQGKTNWFVKIFSYLLNHLTKGWFADFTHSVSSWWDGFWNDFVVAYLYKVDVSVVVTTSDSWPDGEDDYVYLDDEEDDEEEDDDADDRKHCYITITFTYDMQDKGFGFFADKKGLNQDQIDRAAEIAVYLADLFGSGSDEYVPIYTVPGYYDGAKSGGSAAVNIASSLAELADIVSGMTYNPSGAHAFPLQGKSNYPISSHYGPRNFPPDPWHTGIDFSINGGYPVCAVADGVVLYIAQHKSGFGNHIAVYHGSNVVTLYCHLNATQPFGTFRAGDKVNAGDIIGYVGKTGLSTGNHLHFQLHEGTDYNVRNPVGFFDFLDYAKP